MTINNDEIELILKRHSSIFCITIQFCFFKKTEHKKVSLTFYINIYNTINPNYYTYMYVVIFLNQANFYS